MKELIIIALMLFCVGCDRGEYVAAGPVLVDKTMMPKNTNKKSQF